MFNQFYRLGILAVVYRQRKSNIEYLLLHRIRPWEGWELLKGGIGGRTEEEALERELFEEASLRILSKQKIPIRVKYKLPEESRNKWIGQKLQAYLVEVNPEDKVIINFREHDDYCWANYEQSLELLRHKQQKNVLRYANKFLEIL
ncbi:MAG: NUDIX domain-containing protein [Candidatus Aenigmarchaeota archaeon]|nr:NUDIX domain-containing protein [Candidatus Aenigmarchaeota archaeon]